MDSTDVLVRDLIPFLNNIAQMLDEMKVERGPAWTTYNQEQREDLSAILQRSLATPPTSPAAGR